MGRASILVRTGGVTGHPVTGRDIVGDDAAGPDDGVVADLYRRDVEDDAAEVACCWATSSRAPARYGSPASIFSLSFIAYMPGWYLRSRCFSMSSL